MLFPRFIDERYLNDCGPFVHVCRFGHSLAGMTTVLSFGACVYFYIL